jgi:hypothetical protein
VTGGWCKDTTVSSKGCYSSFDEVKPDTDIHHREPSVICTLFHRNMLGGSNSDLLLICGMVGDKPIDWDCKDVNNECSADNFGNNVGVETYTTHDKCTDFGKSMMEICCDVIKNLMHD